MTSPESDALIVSRRDGPLPDLRAWQNGSLKYIVVAGSAHLDRAEVDQLSNAHKNGIVVVPALEFMPRLYAMAEPEIDGAYHLVDHLCSLQDFNEPECTEALAEQVAAIEHLIGAFPVFGSARNTRQGIVLGGDVGNTEIRIAVVQSPLQRKQWSIGLVSRARRMSIEIDISAMSKPALVRVFDSQGEQTETNAYQNSHRLTWKRISRAMSEKTPYGGIVFADHITKIGQARQLFGGHGHERLGTGA